MDSAPASPCAAGLLGAAVLIIAGPGSVVAALTVGDGHLDSAGPGIVGLSFAVVVALVVCAFGSTSGAHINSVGSVVLAATARFPRRDVAWSQDPAYVIGSLLAGLTAASAYVLIARPEDHDTIDTPGTQGEVLGSRT